VGRVDRMDGWSDAIYGEPDSKFEKFGFYFWKTLDLTWEFNRTCNLDSGLSINEQF